MAFLFECLSLPMQLQPIEKISEGFSNQYLVQGFGVVAGGLLCLLVSSYLALPIVIIGIGLLAVRTGVLVDTKEFKYKLYREIFGISFGTWKSLKNTSGLVLKLTISQSTIAGMNPGLGTYRSTSIKTRTFDVLLIRDGTQPKQLNDFVNYKPARRTAVIISKTLNIPFTDKVADKISQNKAKRRK